MLNFRTYLLNNRYRDSVLKITFKKYFDNTFTREHFFNTFIDYILLLFLGKSQIDAVKLKVMYMQISH